MASNFYQKNIVQGKTFLVFAIFVALSLRFAAYFSPDLAAPDFSYSGGYLWNKISFIFADRSFSIIGGFLSVVGIAFLLSFINGKFIIIRKKTLLPSALSLILLSIHPSFMFMGPHYIGVIFVLLTVSYLFQSYQTDSPQKVSVNTSFFIAFGSLFYFNLFFYVIIFWIGLGMIRSFGLKAFWAFIVGLLFIYIPVFAFCSVIGDVESFLLPFTRLGSVDFSNVPCFGFDIGVWVTLGFGLLLLLIFLISNYINSFKDKIKIRTFISFLSGICMCALLFYLFLNVDAFGNLYIYIGVGSLLFAHYFALSENRGAQILFYIAIIFCISVAGAFFLLPQ